MSKPAEQRVAEKMPTTHEMQKALDVTKKHLKDTKKDSDINATGRKIIDDAARVIDSTKRLLVEKNEGEKIQRMMVAGTKAGKSVGGHRHKVKNLQDDTVSNLNTDHLRTLARNVLTTARLAGMELISSSSFRASLLDFVQLASDVFSHPGETSTIAAGERPSHALTKEAKLSHDTTKDVLKRQKKHKEKTAKLSTGEPTVGTSGSTSSTSPVDKAVPPAPPAPKMKKSKKSKFLQDSTPIAHDPAVHSHKHTGDHSSSSSMTGHGVMPTDTTLGPKSTKSKDQLTSLSEQQINALYDRFMDIMRTVARRERSRRVFTGLFDIFDFMAMQMDTSTAKHTAKTTAWDVTHDKNVYATSQLAQEIFEEFTGNKTLDPFLHKMRRIVRTFRKDPESRAYFTHVRSFILDVLKNPGLLDDERKVEEGRMLVRQGSHLSNRKLNRHINGAIQDLRELINNARNDPAINNLRRDLKRLAKDLLLDADGNVAFKPEALDQLRLIIVSTLIQRMKVPLPPIHYSDDAIEYTLKNAVLTVEDMVPDNVYVKEKGKLGVDLSNVRKPNTDRAKNIIKFVIKGINLHMPASDLWFKRKKFPRLEDEGKANIDIGGRGVDIVVVIETFFKSADYFKVRRVWCDVHQLNLHLSDTRHDFLYNTFLKLFKRSIKRNMQNSIERRISSNLDQVNLLLKKQVNKKKLPNTIAQRTVTSKQ